MPKGLQHMVLFHVIFQSLGAVPVVIRGSCLQVKAGQGPDSRGEGVPAPASSLQSWLASWGRGLEGNLNFVFCCKANCRVSPCVVMHGMAECTGQSSSASQLTQAHALTQHHSMQRGEPVDFVKADVRPHRQFRKLICAKSVHWSSVGRGQLDGMADATALSNSMVEPHTMHSS